MKYDYRKDVAGMRRFKYKRFYRLTVLFQLLLYKLGINWHNTFSDECTHGFECCINKLQKHEGRTE